MPFTFASIEKRKPLVTWELSILGGTFKNLGRTSLVLNLSTVWVIDLSVALILLSLFLPSNPSVRWVCVTGVWPHEVSAVSAVFR